MAEFNPMEAELSVTDYTDKKGRCSRCGECCGELLPFTLDWAEEVCEFLERTHASAACSHPVSESFPHEVRAFCPFLDDAGDGRKSCRIYPHRLFLCKNFICSKDEKLLRKDRVLYDSLGEINSLSAGNPVLLTFHSLFFQDFAMDFFIRRQMVFVSALEKGLKGAPPISVCRRLVPLFIDSLFSVQEEREMLLHPSAPKGFDPSVTRELISKLRQFLKQKGE